MNKLVINFKSKDSKKIKNPKNFLGGKGANLAEMERMGLPVPPGYTISTKVCEIFFKDKKRLNSKLISQIKKELKVIEKDVSKKLISPKIALAQYAFQVVIRIDLVRITGKGHLAAKCFT